MSRIFDQDGVTIAEVAGPRLDAAAAPGFKAQASAAFAHRPRRAVIDLSDVEFVDSTGLGVLVSVLKMMDAQGAIAVAGARPTVRRLFEITRLDRVLPLYFDRAEALAGLEGASPAR